MQKGSGMLEGIRFNRVPFKEGERLAPEEEAAKEWLEEFTELEAIMGKDRSKNWAFRHPMNVWVAFLHYLHHRVDGSGPCDQCSHLNGNGKKSPCFGAVDQRLDCNVRSDDGELATRMLLGRRVTVQQLLLAFNGEHSRQFGSVWCVESSGTDDLLDPRTKLLGLFKRDELRSVWSFRITT